MRNWIVIADVSKATIYAAYSENRQLERVRELSHPLSRSKNADLRSDRAGRMRQPARGYYGSPVQSPTEAKTIEAEVFARELAHELKHALDQHEFEQLGLIAPPHFLGILRQALDEQVARKVAYSASLDLVPFDDKELRPHLQEALDALSHAGQAS